MTTSMSSDGLSATVYDEILPSLLSSRPVSDYPGKNTTDSLSALASISSGILELRGSIRHAGEEEKC